MTMMNENMKISVKNVDSSDERAKLEDRVQLNKRDYAAPSLKSLGRLSTVTLGGTSGIGDSGNAANPFDPKA